MTNTSGDEDGRPGRRSSLRRIRSARFSSGGRDTLGTPREYGDADDDIIDPEQVRSQVTTRAQHAQPSSPTPPDTPRQRLHDVAQASGSAYAREYRLSLVGRLVMRKVPLDQIAQQLGVSVSTVEKDRAAWKKMVAESARGFDINEFIGVQSEFYDELAGMALRTASNTTGENAVPVAMQLAAIRTGLASQADKTRMLQAAGVFEAARFRRAQDGSSLSDIQTLMAETRQALMQLAEADAPPPPRNPPPARSRTSGFDAFDMGQEEPEVLEI